MKFFFIFDFSGDIAKLAIFSFFFLNIILSDLILRVLPATSLEVLNVSVKVSGPTHYSRLWRHQNHQRQEQRSGRDTWAVSDLIQNLSHILLPQTEFQTSHKLSSPSLYIYSSSLFSHSVIFCIFTIFIFEFFFIYFLLENNS